VKTHEAYLMHIRDAIARIESYTTGGHETFFREPMVQDAVIRNLEIIGEAVKRVPADLKARHPELPWGKISAMCDVLIHEYFGVDLEIVWDTVRNRIPEFKRHIETLLTGSS